MPGQSSRRVSNMQWLKPRWDFDVNVHKTDTCTALRQCPAHFFYERLAVSLSIRGNTKVFYSTNQCFTYKVQMDNYMTNYGAWRMPFGVGGIMLSDDSPSVRLPGNIPHVATYGICTRMISLPMCTAELQIWRKESFYLMLWQITLTWCALDVYYVPKFQIAIFHVASNSITLVVTKIYEWILRTFLDFIRTFIISSGPYLRECSTPSWNKPTYNQRSISWHLQDTSKFRILEKWRFFSTVWKILDFLEIFENMYFVNFWSKFSRNLDFCGGKFRKISIFVIFWKKYDILERWNIFFMTFKTSSALFQDFNLLLIFFRTLVDVQIAMPLLKWNMGKKNITKFIAEMAICVKWNRHTVVL